MSLSDVIKTALDQMQYIAKTETVIGEPINIGGTTLIPVSRISVGFAAGGGGRDDKTNTGAGTGGGISVIPVAFISVIDGKVHVHPVTPNDPILSKLLAMAPDALKNISNFFKKDKKDSENQESGDKK